MSHSRKAWRVLLVASLAGAAVTANEFKVPPALPPVRSHSLAAGIRRRVGGS